MNGRGCPHTGTVTQPADVLELGGQRPSKRRVVSLVAGLLVTILIALGAVAWSRTRPPQFSLAELTDAYAAFTTNSGGNRVSTLQRANFNQDSVQATPATCDPLVQVTLGTQFPASALDGVLVYSIGEGPDTLSLFTFRYRSAKDAGAEFDTVRESLASCPSVQVQAGATSTNFTVTEVALHEESTIKTQLAYLMSPEAKSRYAVQVLQFGNTITWEYRYNFGSGEYSTQPAEDLMKVLMQQFRDVLAARPR